MRVNSEGNFYIAVPCEALANINIYTALCAPCNERVAQVVEFVSGAKAFECAAYDTLFVREHERTVGALPFLSLEQFPNVWQHIQASERGKGFRASNKDSFGKEIDIRPAERERLATSNARIEVKLEQIAHIVVFDLTEKFALFCDGERLTDLCAVFDGFCLFHNIRFNEVEAESLVEAVIEDVKSVLPHAGGVDLRESLIDRESAEM